MTGSHRRCARPTVKPTAIDVYNLSAQDSLMPDIPRPIEPELQSVLERRSAWLRAAADAEHPFTHTAETPFVRGVIERCRKLQYELAADRYFGQYALHDH